MVKLTRAIRVTQARLVLTFVVIGWATPLARGRELSVEWFFTAVKGPWVPPGRTKYAAQFRVKMSRVAPRLVHDRIEMRLVVDVGEVERAPRVLNATIHYDQQLKGHLPRLSLLPNGVEHHELQILSDHDGRRHPHRCKIEHKQIQTLRKLHLRRHTHDFCSKGRPRSGSILTATARLPLPLQSCTFVCISLLSTNSVTFPKMYVMAPS